MTPQTKGAQLRESIAANYPDLLVLEPSYFDEAIIGLARRCGLEAMCYDVNKILHILMQEEGLSYEDALEHFEFNIAGGYVGETTPIFLDCTDVE